MGFASFQTGGADSSLMGAYVTLPVKCMIYGRGCVKQLPQLLSNLGVSKAFVITGKSLHEKTPVIKDIETVLGSAHAGTYSGVRQHAPIADIQAALSQVRESGADALISIGGGSPIDSAKIIAYHLHEQTGKWLPSITIPTTLSVAETTQGAGYTNENCMKVSVAGPEIAPKAIVYYGDLTLHTPTKLWLSSAIRAVDHAVELQYHPNAPEVPIKRLARDALRELFTLLPQCQQNLQDADIRQKLQLAAYSALFPFSFTGGLGMSHTIGHVIGATYGIPHGITSCITLSPTVHFKAEKYPEDAKQIAKTLPFIGKQVTGDPKKDAHLVGDAVKELVEGLGLKSTLSDYNVKPEEEEAIATRVLGGDKSHSDFVALKSMIRGLY